MNINFITGLALIIFFGILAQWISWRFRLPSILLLLIVGFIAGPISGLIDPDEYFGKLLFPLVSISVAIILFEGGLSLKLSELKSVGKVVVKLITIGVAITWVLATLAAHYLLGMSFPLSVLLGAILVVTGPTVILPILRHVKPSYQVNSMLKWEGIINDPIGALLAILVFEVVISSGFTQASTQVITGLLKTILLSGSVGLAGGYIVLLLLKHKLIPDFLHNSISLALVISVFAISNLFQKESGLLAVTIMGIFLANQKSVNVRHIIEFKENLRVLLLSFLFIILAARLKVSDLEMLSINSIFFVAVLMLIIRPISIYASTLKSKINWKEKLYLAGMAPRGIVAAAVASLFAIELTNAGIKEAEFLVPIMFLVIVSTITIYGLGAIPLAKWLKISSPNPQGCVIIGANALGQAIGKAIKKEGLNVLMVDTNWSNISSARMDGLATYYGSVLSDNIIEEIDLYGMGKLLAITPNNEVNSLASLYFSKIFGSDNVYQLSSEADEDNQGKKVSKHLHAQILFGNDYTFFKLLNKINNGMVIKSTKITEKYNFESFIELYGRDKVIPLMIVDEDKELSIFSKNTQPKPKEGEILISLIEEKEEENI
ncbi:MAG: cation:proton antiporter [Ignavibacteriaceae bacterium]